MIGFQSSGRSAAVRHYALGNPPVRRLTQASRAFFETSHDGWESPLSTPLPILTPARTDELDALQALAADLSPFTTIDWLDAADLGRACPVLRVGEGHAVRGFIDRTALKLDGHGLLQVYSQRLNKSGGVMEGNAAVVSIERTGSVWRVRTDRGQSYETPIIVNAAGAWADAVAAMAGVRPIGLQPMRRTIIVFNAPADVDVSRLPFTKTVRDDLYFGPEAGLVFASPMDEAPTDPCDAQPEEYEVALAAHRIEERTLMKVARIAHRWAGLRSFAPDRVPVVGFAPNAEGFFWLAGQGGAGLQTSPAVASIVASLIAGTPWSVPGVTAAELSPARFFGQGAQVHPTGADQLEQARRGQVDRRVARAGGREDSAERLQRQVDIDGQGRRNAEGADAADRMAGQFQRFLGAKHSRPAAELRLALAVRQPRVAAGGEEEGGRADPDGQRLGDPRRLDPERPRRVEHGRGAVMRVDDANVRRMLRKPGSDGVEAHSPSRCKASSRGLGLRRCSNR